MIQIEWGRGAFLNIYKQLKCTRKETILQQQQHQQERIKKQ